MCQFCEDYEELKKYNKKQEENDTTITTKIAVGIRNCIFVNGYSSGGVTIETYFDLIFCPLCGKRLEEKENCNG